MNLIPATAEISHVKVAEKMLAQGVTMIHVIRDKAGVSVPLSCNTHIVHLNFSYRYGIEDFVVDETGIRASLSFGGQPQWCDVPWSAVVGISSQVTNEFFIWIDMFSQEDLRAFLPPDVLSDFTEFQNESIFDEMPELREYAFDKDDKIIDDDNEADAEHKDDDEEEEPPGGYTPLRFV